MPRRLLLPLSILLALAASACEVRTTVDVAVAEDGSGEVAVTVRLDDEALARVPDVDGDGTSGLADLAALVRTEDLVAAGWTVGEPAESGEGGAALRVTRPFGTPDEADTILAELTGPSGVLRGPRRQPLDVVRAHRAGVQRHRRPERRARGVRRRGLAAALDGEPLGQDAAAIEAAAGVPLAEAVTFEITADLDGRATSWTPVLGEAPVTMAADTTAYDLPVLVLAAVAVAAALALVVVLVVRLVRSRRRG